MLKTRHLASLAVAFVLGVGLVSQAAAAPKSDPLVGTIDGISEGTDGGGNTVIIVDYTDTDGNPQTVQLSIAEASQLGLLSSTDPLDIDEGMIGAAIDLTAVGAEADPCAPSGGGSEEVSGTESDTSTAVSGDGGVASGHPVAGALCEYFQGSLGVSYDTIFGWHQDGFGFGVIAQALFMAKHLGLDAEMILDAKKSGDYGDLGLPEDVQVDNWGQLKKYVMASEVKSLTNLGAIMSGRADPAVTESPTEEPTEAATLSAQTSSSSNIGAGSKGHGKSGEHGKRGEHGKGKGK